MEVEHTQSWSKEDEERSIPTFESSLPDNRRLNRISLAHFALGFLVNSWTTANSAPRKTPPRVSVGGGGILSKITKKCR